MELLSNVLSDGADLAHLAAELDIPTIAGLQHQGDVSVIPAAMAEDDFRRPVSPVPAAGCRGGPRRGGRPHAPAARRR